VRWRVADIDVDALSRMTPGVVPFALFDDLGINVAVSSIRHAPDILPDPNDVVMHGTIDGIDGSDVLLVFHRGVMGGTIRWPDRPAVVINPVDRTHVAIEEQGPGPYGVCGTTGHGISFADRPPYAFVPRDGPQFEVTLMVAYTLGAESDAGSEANIETAIEAAVVDFNQSLSNSTLPTTVRLVAMPSVAFDDSAGDMQANLAALDHPIPGVTDGVLGCLRTRYGADLVSMIVTHSTTTTIGLAHIPGYANGDSTRAFNVVVRPYLSAHVLAHECGHNLGCDHDLPHGGGGLYSYSNANVFVAGGTQHETVMYWSAEPSVVPFFSTPAASFMGVPVGVAIGQPGEADNAHTILLTSPWVHLYEPYRSGSLCYIENTFSDANTDFASDMAISGAKIAFYDKTYSGLLNNQRGRVVIYNYDPSRCIYNQEAQLTGDPQANFGDIIAIDENTIAVHQSGLNEKIFFFDNLTNWSLQGTISFSSIGQVDQFPPSYPGGQIALEGDYLIVPVTLFSNNSTQVLVYKRNSTGSWVQQTNLFPAIGSGFANDPIISVSLHHGVAAIRTSSGRISVFRHDTCSDTWVSELALLNNSFAGVATDGDRVAVGQILPGTHTLQVIVYKYQPGGASPWVIESTVSIAPGVTPTTNPWNALKIQGGWMALGYSVSGGTSNIQTYTYSTSTPSWVPDILLSSVTGAGYAAKFAMLDDALLVGNPTDGHIVLCRRGGIPPTPPDQPAPASPAFAHGPIPVTVGPGHTAVFSDTPTGTPPFTYRWQRNGVDLSDGTNAAGSVISGSATNVLSIANAHASDAGNYTLRVSNSVSCTITSPAARLTISCRVDFDGNGVLGVQDIFAFLNAWFAGSAAANFDGVNGLQVADIFAFLNAWFAGC
jgi:hypothetical protein